MKKSLIALAVLGAFAGAAAAQSSATLYGMIDVGYGVSNGGAYEGSKGNDSKFQQWGNANSTSRWGLKGQEDLGNGTAAYFQLESKISPEDGATNKKLFDRTALVGLKGGFGAIQAGRQTTIVNNVLGRYDLTGTPNLTSALGNVRVSAISQTTTGTRMDSALAYMSPNFSGFSFQAALVLKNNSEPTVDPLTGVATLAAKNMYSVGANYENGPMSIGAAWESKPYDGVSSSWGIGAKVAMSSVIFSAGYFDNHVKEDGKGFYLGAALPIDAFTVGAQVAMNTSAYGAKTTGDTKGRALAWELFGDYKMSDRTSLYLQYGGLDSKAKRFETASRKYSASFGVMHKF